MKIVKLMLNTIFCGTILSNANASQMKITTLYELDLNNSYVATYTNQYGPIALTINVLDFDNPSNPPLWTWQTADMKSNGSQTIYNMPITQLVDTPMLPALKIGQLTFQATFKLAGTIPLTVTGSYLSGTINPLNSIDFIFKVRNEPADLTYGQMYLSIFGNASELPSPYYFMKTLNNPDPLPIFVTIPALAEKSATETMPSNAYKHLDQSTYTTPKELKTQKETTPNFLSNSFFVEVNFPPYVLEPLQGIWFYSQIYNIVELPVIFTINDPNNPNTPLFQQTVLLGHSPTTAQFIMGETMNNVYNLSNPIMTLTPGTLQASLFDGKLILTCGTGSNVPLNGIGFTWTDQYLPAIYPITDSDPSPMTITSVFTSSLKASPLTLTTLIAQELPEPENPYLSIKDIRKRNIKILTDALASNGLEATSNRPLEYKNGLKLIEGTFQSLEMENANGPAQIQEQPLQNSSDAVGENLAVINNPPVLQNLTSWTAMTAWARQLYSNAENWLDDPESNNQ